MKVIEEKHNHLDKVWRKVCFNCGSTLEYGIGDITYDSHKKPFVLCPVCSATIPHNPGEPTETKAESKPDTTSVQPTPEEYDNLLPLNLEQLVLSGGINVDQKFMIRDGRIATFMRSECPRGSLEFVMMVEGRIYRYNWTGVRLEYRGDRWCEVDEREDDIIFMIPSKVEK